jgi:hypothetical protein
MFAKIPKPIIWTVQQLSIAFWAFISAYLLTDFAAQSWPTEQFYTQVFYQNQSDFEKLADFIKKHPKVTMVGYDSFGDYFRSSNADVWKRDRDDKGIQIGEVAALYNVTQTDMRNCSEWCGNSGIQFARKPPDKDYLEFALLDGMGRGWFYNNANHMAYGVFGPRVYIQYRERGPNKTPNKTANQIPTGWFGRTTIDQDDPVYFGIPVRK